jgi:excisionase family DNA binding protein
MTNGCLTLAEAAQELGVHYMTVYRYVRTGKLPARQVAGEWQIDPGDLDLVRRVGPGQPPGTGDRKGPKPWRAQLEARLIAGDEAGAWALVEAVLAAGMKPDESLLELIAPALRSVGGHWESGEWSIADEHRATAVATRLIARLGSRFGRRGVKRGTVVLAAPAGELHALPVSIAANLLRWRGFNVVELGADTPPDALAEAVVNEAVVNEAVVNEAVVNEAVVNEAVVNPGAASLPDGAAAPGAGRQGPLAVALVSTVSGGSRSVRRSIAEVRRARPEVPVLLGGAAIASAAQARRLGADVYTGKRADELVRAVEAIADKHR